MDNKKNGIPKLRFPGFTGAWEQRKLGEVASYRNGKAHEKDISESGKYIVINSKFVSSNGTVRKYSNKMIAPLNKGEISFVLSDVPNGKALARTFLTDQDDTYTLNQRIAGILPKQGVNPYFMSTLMNRNSYFLKFNDGVGQTNLSKRDVTEWKAFYPSHAEQKKIGGFLQQFDSLIALHQRKLEHLQEQKKGLLQKMFPKNGETVPEVRFPGFTDAWEQRKLGEIVEWSKGSGLSKDALNIQRIGVPVIHYADLYKFNSVQKEVIHWTMNNIGTKIPENNLLFPMSDVTPDGLARTSTVLQSNVKAGGDVLIAKLNKDILSTFMSYQINRNKNQILPLVTGTTVRHINSKSLSTLKVTVPGKNEQKYVGSILMRFDSLIALHQRKLEHLELMKKGLLQQMFV